MASEMKSDFGWLYRRAFAEKDPFVKNLLLQQVQSQLDEWHQSSERIQPHPEQPRVLADAAESLRQRERRRA